MSESGPRFEEPAEHRRFRGYLHALGQVHDADETDLVTRVLADPDRRWPDWLQRKTAAALNADALALLAEHGRTRWIRNAARRNPQHPGPR